MPTIKMRDGKLIVCCGENDCVEIDTSGSRPVGGQGDDDPYIPPISRGAALAKPELVLGKLMVSELMKKQRFWPEVEQMQLLSKSQKKTAQRNVAVLVVPAGSRLKLSALQNLSRRLDANLEVRFDKE